MRYKLNLEDVGSQYGAPMGRPNYLPDDREQPYLMHLTRLRWVDGDYDSGGAYWGYSSKHGDIYCAEVQNTSSKLDFWQDEGESVRVFVRAKDRELAKQQVRKLLPNARFYR